MLSLVYVSRVVPSRVPVESLFQAILAVAREKNKALNITGLLAYADGHFVQLIEGDRAEVLKLYASITRDNRHSDVTILSSQKITQRAYNEWAMGGALLSNRSVDMLRQLQQIRDAGASGKSASANDYFRHLLTPVRISDSVEETQFMRPVRHIAICATSLVWLNTFFTFLRDLLKIKIDSLIASDPSHTNPNLPIDYCDIDHPKFGPLRITSFYADMMQSPLAVPLLHRTDYLLGLFARGPIEMKLSFASRLFQHPSVLESKPQSVLVTQDDDSALKSLVTQYVNKAKLPKPQFLAADASPQACWDHILEWLTANPAPSVVENKNIDFDVTTALPPAAAPLTIPVTPRTAIVDSNPVPKPASLADTSAVVRAASAIASTPTVPVPAPPVAAASTQAPAPVSTTPIKESLELEHIFNAAATLPGFRFAAIADTQSTIRTNIRATKTSKADALTAFATALPLIQEWLTLGVGEWSDHAINKTINSLVINQEDICRFAYKLGADSSYALVLELESKHTNIALTHLRIEEIKAALVLS